MSQNDKRSLINDDYRYKRYLLSITFFKLFKSCIEKPQGIKNITGKALFCFPKSKQIICLFEGSIRNTYILVIKQSSLLLEG